MFVTWGEYMRRLDQKQKWICGLAAVLCYGAIAVAAQLLLRNLYLFLPADTAFPAIFAQIQTARMYTPVIPFLLAGYLVSLLLCRVLKARFGWLAAVVLIPVILVVMVVCGVFFTKVNHIRFGDVLLSLLEMLEKGGLDGL